MTTPTVVDQQDQHRFTLETDAGPAFLTYRREDDRLVLLHTEVPVEAEGQGLGSTLVRAALDQVREAGQRVVPLCPFVTAWLRRHPDYADLVTQG